MKSLKERLEEKIALVDDCWEWQSSRDVNGYGRIKVMGKYQPAHRISYQLFKGEIPQGMIIRHQCDNLCCVNPDHLLAGTYQDNVDDMFRRGRQPSRTGENNGRAKLSQREVELIRSDKRTQMVIASHFGVSQTQVSMIKARKKWNSSGANNEQ